MVKAFAILHTWPDVRNAEYEVLQRIIKAAQNAGFSAVVVDNNGCVLWAEPALGLRPGKRIRRADVEFMLSLHFESPRLVDIYSYYALWQPISFYYDFGYQLTIDKVTTHNDLISCASDLADAHAVNLFDGLGRKVATPLPQMFHMLPEPFLPPSINETSRLFYIGINWERLGRLKGRFHDTLVSLDEKGLTDIYGPEKMFETAPWEGFKTYRGELPFDGTSVKRAINRAGICLALSSAQHRATGIMSNRLFEGLAGGAAVIATPNAIIDKYFAEVVYLVDDSRGEEALGQGILEAVHDIRANREEATRRVIEGQRILREKCSLEGSLRRLFDNHAARVETFEMQMLADAEVTVILIDDYGSVDEVVKRVLDYRRQHRAQVDLHIVCDYATAAALAEMELAGEAVVRTTVHGLNFRPTAPTFDGIVSASERSGRTVHDILQACRSPYFMLAGVNEQPFSDHLASLTRALDDPGAMMSCSGAISQAGDVSGKTTRSLASIRFIEPISLLLVEGSTGRGRFLFRSALIGTETTALFELLDGEEHRYFQLLATLTGPVTQTSYATYLVDGAAGLAPRIPAETAERQQQYVRDRFRRDERRPERIAYYVEKPQPPLMSSIPAPPRQAISLNSMLPTTEGGAGLAFLTGGFSHPEPEHIWVAGLRAVIDFRLPDVPGTRAVDLDLVLRVEGRRSRETGRDQHCSFFVNGLCIAYQVVPQEATELRLRLPSGAFGRSPDIRFEMVPDHAEEADKAAEAVDPRTLSLKLMAFGLMEDDLHDGPTFAGGSIYQCGTNLFGARAILRNFYAPEPNLVWQAGREGFLSFKLTLVPRRPRLVLGVWGRRAQETGERQQLSVTVNGEVLGTYEIADRLERLVVPLNVELSAGADVNVTLTVAHAEAVYDENGTLIDGRLLGLALNEIGVTAQPNREGNAALGDEQNGPLTAR